MSQTHHQIKVLMLDAGSGFYRMQRYRVGDFFGPVDLGVHLAHKHNSLNIGGGLLAGSVFPGSNRLVVTGISPCWHGFYVSTMGRYYMYYGDAFLPPRELGRECARRMLKELMLDNLAFAVSTGPGPRI